MEEVCCTAAQGVQYGVSLVWSTEGIRVTEGIRKEIRLYEHRIRSVSFEVSSFLF